MQRRSYKLLLGVSVALLTISGATPAIWQAISHFEALRAAASLGLVNEPAFPGSAFALAVVLFMSGVAGAICAARGRVWLGRIIFAFGAAIALWSIAGAFSDLTHRRSIAVNAWPVCETGVSPGGYVHRPSSYRQEPYFDGPHLDDGTSCTRAAEARRLHAYRFPKGDLLDGLDQVRFRFRDDRTFVFRAIPAALAGLLAAVALFVIGARAETHPLTSRQRRLVASIAVSVIAMGLFVGFLVYDLGIYWKETAQECGLARYGETLEDRRQALAVGLARAHGPMSILPNAAGFRAGDECEAAAHELNELSSKGACPYAILKDVPCQCGTERTPYARCPRPQCAPLNPPRFRCPDDG